MITIRTNTPLPHWKLFELNDLADERQEELEIITTKNANEVEEEETEE